MWLIAITLLIFGDVRTWRQQSIGRPIPWVSMDCWTTEYMHTRVWNVSFLQCLFICWIQGNQVCHTGSKKCILFLFLLETCCIICDYISHWGKNPFSCDKLLTVQLILLKLMLITSANIQRLKKLYVCFILSPINYSSIQRCY